MSIQKSLFSTKTFNRLLFEKGIIDNRAYENADRYLGVHDRDKESDGSEPSLDCALCLDELAVTYLQEAGVLQASCHGGLDLRVSTILGGEQNALISANREGDKLVGELDKIRIALRESVQSGKSIFLPWREIGKEEVNENVFQVAPTLAQFLRDVEPCDAICVDDRFINSNGALTDQSGRSVPVLCVLDVLDFLEKQGLLTSDEKQEALHKLRMAGFALIPVDAAELWRHLKKAQFSEDGKLQENRELRVLRQTLMHIRSLNMLQIPLEFPYLAGLRLASIMAIRRIWEDKEISGEHAAVLSGWIWRNVAPSPFDWAGKDTDVDRKDFLVDSFVQHTSLLFSPIPTLSTDRYQIFRDWLEREVIDPLLPANSELVDALAQIVGDNIKRLSEEIADDTS